MKFTEEQYHKIIKAWRSSITYGNKTDAVIDCLIDDLNLDAMLMGEKALAIANPATRELAHEQYVEKEKRYVWTSERKTGDVFMRLYKSKRGYIGSTLVIENGETGLYEKLTESEIREWGYNPEMFNKEEVE